MSKIPIPRSATPEVQETFHRIIRLLDTILGVNNFDLHKRRMINAGDARDDGDYVTLRQIKDKVVEIIQEENLGGGGSSPPLTAGAGAVLFTGPTGQIQGDSIRLRWDAALFELTVLADILGAAWRGAIIEVAFGGTGLSSGSPGGVLAFTAPDAVQSSGPLASGRVVVGGGTGVPTNVAVLSADPLTPSEGDVWFVATGVSPARTLTLKAFESGATRTLASTTY